MSLNDREQRYWQQYLDTLDEKPVEPFVEASIAGNPDIANELLGLYLDGKKTAGSGLVKDYVVSGDPLPVVGNFWIILDRDGEPSCIVKTVRVEIHAFNEVTEAIALAEGEGDCSLAYWRDGHRQFFTPYLDDLGIVDLETAEVVTEFFDVVF